MRGFTPGKRAWTIVVCLWAAVRAAAQWYAPPTEYHDPVQRVFPVEFARILAWRENLAGAKLQEVAYEVTTAEDGRTAWTLRWIGDDGATWREQRVEYGAEQLRSGAGFYREVRRQLLAEPWAAAKGTTTVSDERFWADADARGVSRLAGFRFAMQLAAELTKEPDGPAREALAGRLLAAALPGVSGLVTLDSTLSARGAVWLALAEGPEAAGGVADRRWAPVLWLSRRERAAQALWTAGPPPAGDPTDAAVVSRSWWSELLTPRAPNEVFLSAAKYPTLARQVPLLAYGARLKDRATLLGAGLAEVCGDEAALLGCYDHAFWIWYRGSVETGHLTDGAWAAEARRDWLATTRECFPVPGAKPVAAVRAATGMADRAAPPDPALADLDAVAYDLNRGFSRKRATLRPVAIANEDDLRTHGAEIVGLTLAGRFWFLERKYGDHAAAADFFEYASSRLRSLGVFTAGRKGERGTVLLAPEDAARLERIEHFGSELAKTASLPVSTREALRAPGREAPRGPSTSERARGFGRSDWLLPDRAGAAMERLTSTQQHPLVSPLVQRAHAEGGGILDRRLAQEVLFTNFPPAPGTPNLSVQLTQLGGRSLAMRAPGWLDRAALGEELTVGLPDGDPARREVWDQRHRGDPMIERARGLERLFWLEPGDDDAEDVFARYLSAGAFVSAKRFFEQFTPHAQDGVRFSNNLGSRRLTLALLERDITALRKVQAVSQSGSASDLVADLTAAAALGNQAGVARLVDVYRERYPSSDPKHMMNVLHDFLPLWPALATPGHPDRERALDHFAECEAWPTLQWFIARQAKLSAEEGIRFLGGDEAKRERRILVAFLRRDVGAFDAAYDDIASGRANHRWQTMAFVVVEFLRAQLHGQVVTEDDPTLCPARPRSLVQQLHDARSKG